MSSDHSNLTLAAEMIDDAQSIVILTGAGVSAESGLATFRDPEEGHWSKYDPMELATVHAFNKDPELVTRWYHWRFTRARNVEPNPGHYAIGALQKHKSNADQALTLITQNVDGLHQRGGASDVVELHGTIHTWRCTKTGKQRPLTELSFDTFPIPSDDGGLMRPCIVWFGESLPEDALQRSFQAMAECDLFISIGTSGTVEPAASFILAAKENGAKTIEINRDPTPNTGIVDVALQGASGVILPQILTEIGIEYPTP
ncbi:MAG: NAD-dependent deacylase [Phycisphaerales bacterium]|nr:NAD-dependent deacylase [Phycisphaerales bacterium]